MWIIINYNELRVSEWVVIIGTRIEAKARTREKIIDATKLLIQKRGFVKISSKEISKECGVSQGSIFLHFKTKDGLLTTILSSNIESLEQGLISVCKPSDTQDFFLKNYLEILSIHEDMLSRIYKDYSYLDNKLQKQVDGLEIMFKNIIFDNYKKNTKAEMSIVDSFIAIDAFLSQIKDYLMSKETFTSSNSIIRQKRGRIGKLYKMLFL